MVSHTSVLVDQGGWDGEDTSHSPWVDTPAQKGGWWLVKERVVQAPVTVPTKTNNTTHITQ